MSKLVTSEYTKQRKRKKRFECGGCTCVTSTQSLYFNLLLHTTTFESCQFKALLSVRLDSSSDLSYSLKRSLVVCSVASDTACSGSSCKMPWKSCSRLCLKFCWERLTVGSPEPPTARRTGRKSRRKTKCTGQKKYSENIMANVCM